VVLLEKAKNGLVKVDPSYQIRQGMVEVLFQPYSARIPQELGSYHPIIRSSSGLGFVQAIEQASIDPR